MQNLDQQKLPIWRRIIGGSVLVVIGLTMIAISWSYPSGSLTQMGPGFMPHLIALALITMGIAVIVSDLRDAGPVREEQVHWRALVFISGAVIIFIVLIEPAGLIPAMFCAVAASMLANKRSGFLSILIYSAAVTLAGWFLFIVALGLPLTLFGR
ncbi:tripartite tricarboxylate transporter TctB family protein [Roseibium algae]|uniref:Tripartite tricarboxylate transporter TctB family protein n=1 Tax=Roseibium algae TaxID=3123038 RepID=A0ABU8TPN3_9HYPH